MSAILKLGDLVDPPAPSQALAPVFTPGVYTNEHLSNEDYHRLDALSSTGIKQILRSPMHYRYWRDHPQEERDALILGSALHMSVLEPDRFAADVVAVPDDAPRKPTSRQRGAMKPSPATLSAIGWWDDWEASTVGKVVISAEQRVHVEGMGNAVRRHPVYQEFLVHCLTEVSYLWNDARLGTPCRCRFDLLHPEHFAFDLKSTRDASPDGFSRAVASYSYHLQEAHYRNGYEHIAHQSLQAFAFIAVENLPPYGVAVYVNPSNAIRYALNRVEEALILYDHCMKTGYWRGYSEKIQPLVLPRWATQLAVPGV